MRIRMLADMTGLRDGQPWPKKGEETDLPTATAAHLVAAGVAEEVPEDGKPQRKRRPQKGDRREDGPGS
ncbi:hypothetical protein E3E14_25280 [Streptomyces sp. ICN441]|uniref:hypothetical protein n=1 Tax=Streptomyces sp. ICN441 TaxID=2558286 RepID=UPI00106C5939|nr:hypothetical protein [Streptomyces sp. ICN441]TFE42499.1 hypothetical protein E3E14_25280 [Streptomyces sp. ICN441]